MVRAKEFLQADELEEIGTRESALAKILRSKGETCFVILKF